MEIKLGSKVKDKVTGFKGTVTARIEYLNGCIQYCVMPKVAKDNKAVEGQYIDVEQLEIEGTGLKIKSKPGGGPQRDCPKH
jgi:hypothetical protein